MNAMENPRVRMVAMLLAILGGLTPVVAYWMVLGRAPNVSPQETKDALAAAGDSAVLVDVRSAEAYAAQHIDAAHNWPYERIMALASAADVPEELRGKRLYLICDSGILSGFAAQRLRERGVLDIANVQGGMQAWVGAAEKPCTLSLCRLRQSGATQEIPFRESPPLEQAVAVVTGFFVKPLYTLISFVLALLLWRQRSPELVAFRWAMICFFVGENFCAANYLISGDQSILFEYLHSYGMVLCFGLTIYALLEGIDRRLIRLSDPNAHCAALGLCRHCIKHNAVPCGLRRVFVWLIPAVMIVALAPLCAELLTVSYNTRIYGTFYNYSHAVIHQVFEIRYLPATALVLLAISWTVLKRCPRNPVLWSKLFFAAAVGALGFSLFRLVLLQVYRDNLVWFAAWEEVTELLFILGSLVVLWVFREALLRRPAMNVPGDAPAAARV